MSQVRAYSELLEEVVDIGLPTENLDALLELGNMMAANRPGLIVYVDGPALQRWEDAR